MGFHRTGCGHARLRMYVELVSVGPSQFILEHYFRFPYLIEGVQHGLSKRNFPGTDRHRSQLRCNDPRVSIRFLLGTGRMPHPVGGAMGVALCTAVKIKGDKPASY